MKTLGTLATTALLALLAYSPLGASPVGGTREIHGYLAPNSGWQTVMYVELRGGAMTSVSLRNVTNSADLDVRVFDQFNNLVAEDIGTAPDAFVSIFVPWTGLHRIEIRNFSGPGALYRLTVY